MSFIFLWAHAKIQQPVILNQVENELQETVHQAGHTLVVFMEQLKAVSTPLQR